MVDAELLKPKWWQGLSFRVGLCVGVCILIGDFAAMPLYDAVFGEPHETWCPEEENDLPVNVKMMGMSLAYALVVGSTMGWLAARFSMPRLRAITRQATSTEDGDLPGPFEESGQDEITQVARALNRMRDRVDSLLGRLADGAEKRNEWVAQVSHDLRTPLTALITSLEHTASLLERENLPEEELRRNNSTALLGARRVAAMSEDLLEIARLEIENSIQTEPVLAGEIAEHTLQTLDPLARKAGLKMELDIEPLLPILAADGRLVFRALENLVLNSIQHASGWVRVSVSRVADEVVFRVEDDGKGLPEEEGLVSFDRLKTHRSRADSAGLGLMVTQRVAEAHGGALTAQNRSEGGALVEFTIPVGNSSVFED